MVGNGSSEILHGTMSLVTKLLTMCTEVGHGIIIPQRIMSSL